MLLHVFTKFSAIKLREDEICAHTSLAACKVLCLTLKAFCAVHNTPGAFKSGLVIGWGCSQDAF